MAYINLSHLPDPKTEYSMSLSNLFGGLNIKELDYELDNNESPEMKNLMWKDGVLSSRDGQMYVNSTVRGYTYAAYPTIWHGYKFAHIGTKIYAFKANNTAVEVYSGTSSFTEIGTFFTYNDKMYYKSKGFFVQITDNGTSLSSANLGESGFTAYTPIIVINANPASGAGDTYQPENRLSADKTIWYTADYKVTMTTNNSALSIYIEPYTWKAKVLTDGTYVITYDGTDWTLNGSAITLIDYGITVSGTPVSNDTLTVVSSCVKDYYLPIKGKDIVSVEVDGTAQTGESATITTQSSSSTGLTAELDKDVWRTVITASGTYVFTYDGDIEVPTWKLNDTAVTLSTYGITVTGTPYNDDTITVTYTKGGYYYDKTNGIVHFYTAPQITIPLSTNTVHITYTLPNTTSYNNIMDCKYVAVYGGTGGLCVVMAGSTTQPNAYFWNGQTSIDMDVTYFPAEQYQLAGDVVDPITGFGKQQSYLVIFKEHSVGRTILDTEEINDRTYIDLPYTPINAKIGCDLPWSIQLVDNNLVWANTSQGVHLLKDSSSAYENNIICISSKVNGSMSVRGLLLALRNGGADKVISLDDEKRYWICVEGSVWMWDYYISEYKDPSWFYFDNIPARAFCFKDDVIWHFDSQGRLTKFSDINMDYEGSIEKVYKFAVQNFGSFDRVKNVNSVEIETRGDSNTETKLEYITDLETRTDYSNAVSMDYDSESLTDVVIDDLTWLRAYNKLGTYKFVYIGNSVWDFYVDDEKVATRVYISDYHMTLTGTPTIGDEIYVYIKGTLQSYTWNLIPRNLESRDLSGSGFARVFRRRPYCRHVHFFTMRLSNNIAGQNLSIVGAQIFYNYQGRQR